MKPSGVRMSPVRMALWLTACCAMSAADTNLHNLYDALMEDYNPKLLPSKQANTAVTVEVQLQLIQIIELDERRQQLASNAFFVTRWRDEYLTWDPETYDGIKSIVLPPSDVWRPDFGLENSATTFYHDSFQEDFMIRVFHDGTMQWSFGGQFITMCTLDLTLYPFDIQECHINLENWAYTGDEVALTNGSAQILLDAYTPNGIWDILYTEIEKENHYYAATDNIPFPEIEHKLFLRRKSFFYILNLVLPCFFSVLVALGVFWVPPGSGEKVSLAITVLLAFTVFQLVLQEQTPKNSDYAPLIGRLVLTVMGLSSVSVLTSIVVLYFHSRECHHRVPHCIRVLFFKGLARVLFIKVHFEIKPSRKVNPNKTQNTDDVEIETIKPCHPHLADLREAWPGLVQISDDMNYLAETVRAKEIQNGIMAEWQLLALIIDRVMFVLALIVVIAMAAQFLSYHNNFQIATTVEHQ